jgi:hypothetical protein
VEHVKNRADSKNARTGGDLKESMQGAMPSISPAEIRRARNVFVIACEARLQASFFLGHLNNNVTSRLYLGFHWKNFPATLRIVFSTHTLATVQVCLLSVTNQWNFIWKTKYLFRCISASNGGVSHKIHTSHSSLVRHKSCNFDYVRSVINGTLLEEQRGFLVVYQLPLEGFS